MRKISRYLKKKDASSYTHLDAIFNAYVDGTLQELLDSKGFINIEYFRQIRRNRNCLQIQLWYHNLVVTAEFRDNDYDYGVYLPGCTAEEFEQCIHTYSYSADFTIAAFVNSLSIVLDKDSRLRGL